MPELDDLFEQKVRPELAEDQVSAPKAKVFSLRKNMLGVAATISLLVVATIAFRYFSGGNKQDLYANYYKPFKASNLRSNASEDIFWSGVELYQKQEYAMALPVFQKSLANTEGTDKVQLLIGVCQLQLDQTEAAVTSFSQIQQGMFLEDAKWYLALAHIRLNQEEKAKEVLQDIVAGKGNYAQKATQILKAFNGGK